MTAYQELYDEADRIMKKRGIKGRPYRIETEGYGAVAVTVWGEIIDLEV